MGQPKIKGRGPKEDQKPRVAAADTVTREPVWRVGRIDFGGPWCPRRQMTPADLELVLERFKSLETMPWQEIEAGAGSHFVEVTKLIPDAQKRLVELHLDDLDALFSLRIKGAPRVWGLKINNVFSALWWDPEHKICPSLKKHT